MVKKAGFRMQKFILKFLIISIAVYSSSALAAEVKELELEGAIGYLIPPYAFTLRNDAGRDINFYLGTDKNNLTKQQLSKDVMKPFSDGKSAQYTIEIPTRGREAVKYRLSAGKRYRIFWNDEGQRWDIETLGH